MATKVTKLPKYVMIQHGNWYVRRFFKSVSGKYVSIKRKCETETPEAAAALAKQIADLVLRPQPAAETLWEYLDRYKLAKQNNVSTKVYEAITDYFDRHVRNTKFAALRIVEIKTRDVQTFYDSLDRSPSVIHELHKHLSAAFNQGIKWEDLTRNPCKGVMLPKESRSEVKVMDLEQSRRFIALCRETDDNICLEFALETGMRPQEYLALRWSDVAGRSVKVRRALVFGLKDGGVQFKEPKTKGSRRTIQISPELRERLDVHHEQQMKWIASLKRTIRHSTGYRAKQTRKAARVILNNIKEYDLLFPSDTGGPRSPENFNKWKFKPMIAKIGMEGSSYVLRHTSITLLLAAGVDVKTIAEKCGTSPEVIWKTYAHVLDSMRTSATEKISAALY